MSRVKICLGVMALDATFNTTWTMVVNQMGAVAQAGGSTYLQVTGGDNTADVPLWTTTTYGDYTYRIFKNGSFLIQFTTLNEGNCVNGDVGNPLKLTLPYMPINSNLNQKVPAGRQVNATVGSMLQLQISPNTYLATVGNQNGDIVGSNYTNANDDIECCAMICGI